VVSLQKAVRDRLENIKVTDIYYGICWFATLSSIVLLAIGLWNATILPVKKASTDLPFYWHFRSHCGTEKYRQYASGIKNDYTLQIRRVFLYYIFRKKYFVNIFH
jgi:uncharacterized membrane protein YiaA